MADTVTSKVINKSQDEDYPFRKKVIDYKKFVSFYFVPIGCIIIFLLIIAFAVIPSVKYMLDGLNEVKMLEAESDELDKRIARLEELELQSSEKEELLAKVNQLIPSEQSQVVNFRQKVASLGESQGLVVESLRAGETILKGEENVIEAESANTFSLIEIPSRFSFTGSFNSFRQLLQELYSGDDFFVVSNMDLDVNSIGSTNTSWKGEFDLIKYQFSDDTDQANYLEVSDFAEANQTVVNFIEENFIDSTLN